MAEKQYYWLKLEKDFFKSKEIKKLRKIAGGDTLTIIYLKMALYSLENEGILVYEGIEDDLASELSLELDEEVENIKLVLAFLQNNKMIETKGEDFYLNRIPEMTGKETGAAKRMRISRQRKEENKQLECNKVTELLQDVTTSYTEKEKDIELEKEKDIEKEIKKENIYTEIFNHYLSKENLIKHTKFTEPMEKGIKKAIKTYDLDFEYIKRIIDRHSEKVEVTKDKGEYKTTVRTLAELFGQKKFKSEDLICSDYLDEVYKTIVVKENEILHPVKCEFKAL